MPERIHNAYESKYLHATAAQSRLRVIESQLSLGLTLCALADTEILYRQYSQAHKILDRVKHAAHSIGCHLDEPEHLPGDAIASLRKQLKQLEARAEQVESRLQEL